MNPFARLQLPVSLVLDEATLKNAHHQAAAIAPQAELEEIHQAHEQLRDPSRRIAAFQKIHGQTAPPQATPGGALFDFFSTVETAYRETDLALHQAASASTALQRAAHLPALLEAQAPLEKILLRLRQLVTDRTLLLQWMDEDAHELSEEEWTNLRIIASDFVFLAKWEEGARLRLGKIQALLFGELA